MDLRRPRAAHRRVRRGRALLLRERRLLRRAARRLRRLRAAGGRRRAGGASAAGAAATSRARAARGAGHLVLLRIGKGVPPVRRRVQGGLEAGARDTARRPMSGPPEAEILFALIRERYAARLDAAQLGELRKTVEGIVRHLAALRAVG